MDWDELREWYFSTPSGRRDSEDVPEDALDLAAEVVADRSRDLSDRTHAFVLIKDVNTYRKQPKWHAFAVANILDPTQPSGVRSVAVDALERWCFAGSVPEEVFRDLEDMFPNIAVGIERAWALALCSLDGEWAVRRSVKLLSEVEAERDKHMIADYLLSSPNPHTTSVLLEYLEESANSEAKRVERIVEERKRLEHL